MSDSPPRHGHLLASKRLRPGYEDRMERQDETQEQGGGEQTEEGGPSGAPGDGEQTDDTSSDDE
jgi:hypothetical protein